MTSDTLEKIHAIYRKYHLTARQSLQLQWLILAVAQGKRVVYVVPRPAGQQTIIKAAREIIKLLNLDLKNLKAKSL